MARSKRLILLRVPSAIKEELEQQAPALRRGAATYITNAGIDYVLTIEDQSSIAMLLSRVLDLMEATGIPGDLKPFIPIAYTYLKTAMKGQPSVRQWPQLRAGSRQPLDEIANMLEEFKVIRDDPDFEPRTVKYALALFTVAYYLLHLAGATEVKLPTAEQSSTAYWTLVGYEPEYPDHLVVRVANIVPTPLPDTLVAVSDPFGVYHDIIFASALLAGIHTKVLAIKNDLAYRIQQLLPVQPPPDDASFEEAFEVYQRNLVMAYPQLSKRIQRVAQELSHLATVMFMVDPNKDKDQFGKEATFVDVRLRPGTYWVHANFLTILPDDKVMDQAGTTRRNDVALFTDPSYLQAPALRVTKYHLFKLLADPKANRKEYLILARSWVHTKPKKAKESPDISLTDLPEPIPGTEVYELLSVIPISPEVVVRRKMESDYANVLDVRDTFGLDTPSSHKEVLDSLYLLARAYAPSYAVLYDGGVVGKDQYLALIASMLSYLSPTLSLTQFDRKYDPRIHTLLYGIKGVGKTYLLEQYGSNWPHNTLPLFASVRITEAKLLGGAVQLRAGRTSKLVFEPGEIIKSDGGLILIDELDRLARESDKRAIADAIANVMASGYAPARHVLSDSPAIDVRVHASVLAAANPLGLKSGQYVEEMLAAMFILNDEIRSYYKKLAPEVVEAIERKFFEKTTANLEHTAGRKLIAELEYLASDTPYTFIHNDFYTDPTLHKYIDRVSFAIPMYTMVGEPPQEFLRSGKTSSGEIAIYDKAVADGKLTIAYKSLLDYTLFVQTVSPFAHGDSEEDIFRLLNETTKISSAWRKAASKTYSQKISTSSDTRETMRVLLRSFGTRESQVTYRLAHTILKLFDDTELRKPYIRAIMELVNIRDSLLYSNPSGQVRTPIPIQEALRMAIRDLFLSGSEMVDGQQLYFARPEDLEAVYVDILTRYSIRIPDKGDTPFDAVEYFQDVVKGAIGALQRAGILVTRQDSEGELYPALVGTTPEELARRISFRVNKQGYLHIILDNTDLGSLGKVVK